MPTKLEIFSSEQMNVGEIILYPEGVFFKAYEKSAFLLCTKVHPFKVSVRPLKGLNEPLVSVGFPFSSLEKFATGMAVERNCGGGVLTLLFSGGKPSFDGFAEWKSQFQLPENQKPSFGLGLKPSTNLSPFDALPVYNSAYRLVLDLCVACAKIQRDYKYSLGEQVRLAGLRMLVCISEALKQPSLSEYKSCYLKEAREKLSETQLCLRLLNDLHVISDKRYVGFADITQEISKQLYSWEKCEKASRPE